MAPRETVSFVSPRRGETKFTVSLGASNKVLIVNFALSVSPGKKMGDRKRERNKIFTSAEIEPTTSDLVVGYFTD